MREKSWIRHFLSILTNFWPFLFCQGFRNLDFACWADLCPIFLVKFQKEMGKSWRWHDWPEKGTIPIKIKIESLAWQRQYHSGNYDQSSTNCEENLIDSLALTILCTVKMEAYFCSETNFLAQSFVNGVGPKTAKDSKQKRTLTSFKLQYWKSLLLNGAVVCNLLIWAIKSFILCSKEPSA